MAKLAKLPGLPADAAELLEAVGYLDTEDLCDAKLDELISELVGANEALEIMTKPPTRKKLAKWQELAGAHEAKQAISQGVKKAGRAGKEKKPKKSKAGSDAQDTVKKPEAGETPELVNLEEDPDMQAMLAISPEAEALDPGTLDAGGLDLDDISSGVLLNRCEANIKINIMTTLGATDSHMRQDEIRRLGLKPSRIRNFEDFRAGNITVKPLDKGRPKDESEPSQSINRGVDPGSRRFIRGVLHPSPASISAAAKSVLLLVAVLVVNLVGIPSVVMNRHHFADEHVLLIVICLPVIFLLAAANYIYFAYKARCRVCGQRPLMSKKCIRHKKAHHVWGIGYILPTALQLLFYDWFYCTYCGTAIRLKK